MRIFGIYRVGMYVHAFSGVTACALVFDLGAVCGDIGHYSVTYRTLWIHCIASRLIVNFGGVHVEVAVVSSVS